MRAKTSWAAGNYRGKTAERKYQTCGQAIIISEASYRLVEYSLTMAPVTFFFKAAGAMAARAAGRILKPGMKRE
jgi:hypothetical protein